MDLEQLRLRADPLRQFLAQHQHPISHNPALDLLAALAGLRNWPEVKAFPERVAAANLDTLAAQRLAKRIVSVDGPHVDEGAYSWPWMFPPRLDWLYGRPDRAQAST